MPLIKHICSSPANAMALVCCSLRRASSGPVLFVVLHLARLGDTPILSDDPPPATGVHVACVHCVVRQDRTTMAAVPYYHIGSGAGDSVTSPRQGMRMFFPAWVGRAPMACLPASSSRSTPPILDSPLIGTYARDLAPACRLARSCERRA